MFGEIIGSGISAAANAALAKKQFEYSQQLAAQQNQYNLDMWRLQADYNSPASQMQRFQEAGLNPNLIYGQGTSGNMSQAPQQVTASPPDYGHVMSDLSHLGAVMDIANRIEQYRGQRAENQLKQDKHDLLQQQWIGQNLRNAWEQYKQVGLSDLYGGESGNVPSYFRDLFDLQLDRLRKSNLVASTRATLNNTMNMLNSLQSNFYRVRNAWQPWQYGVDMGTKVLDSLIPFGRLFKPANQVIKNFNSTKNNYSGGTINTGGYGMRQYSYSPY